MKKNTKQWLIVIGVVIILIWINKTFSVYDLTEECKAPVFIGHNCKFDGDSTITCPSIGHEFCEVIQYRCPYVTGNNWPPPDELYDCIYYWTHTLQPGESEGSNCAGRYVLYLYGCLSEVPPPPPMSIPEARIFFSDLFDQIWEHLKILFGW